MKIELVTVCGHNGECLGETNVKSEMFNNHDANEYKDSVESPIGILVVPLKESSIWIQMLIGFITVIKATIGTGILFAPYSIVNTGYGISIVFLIFYWFLNIICTLLLLECADKVNDTYSGIASHAMGKVGRIIADVSLIFTQISFCSVFATFVTKAIQNVISGIYDCDPSYIDYGTALITFLQLVIYIPLSCLGRIQSLGPAMIIANISLFIGIIIVFVYSAMELSENIANNTVYYIPSYTDLKSVAGFIGTAAFLWVSGPVVLSYYVSIAEKHTRKMFKWVYFGAISLVFVITVAFTYVSAYGFGKNTFTTITLNLPISPGSITGQIFFALSVLLSFPLMNFPIKEIFTNYITTLYKRYTRKKIIEFIVPAEQEIQLSNQRNSKINTPIVDSQKNSPFTERSSGSIVSRLGSKVLLRQPSGSISFTIENPSRKRDISYYIVKAAPSTVTILISIFCCLLGYFLINSLGNFVNLVGGLFCVPISIILPALFHLTMLKKDIRITTLILDIILIICGIATAVVVIWYTLVSWSVSNESICRLNS
ncbi:hypothetical protein FG386_003696 [Cryptosporidium ryanae]|uniref:uncharacterized protein n=1 Tax=Cryptosporidium ryanae TaxID=515981 RepID=UPI003519F94E|nr:hypothetical protein FG386_003696 [Cryptosporidium ryanae]